VRIAFGRGTILSVDGIRDEMDEEMLDRFVPVVKRVIKRYLRDLDDAYCENLACEVVREVVRELRPFELESEER